MAHSLPQVFDMYDFGSFRLIMFLFGANWANYLEQVEPIIIWSKLSQLFWANKANYSRNHSRNRSGALMKYKSGALMREIYERIPSVISANCCKLRFFESFNIFFSHFCRGSTIPPRFTFTPMVVQFFGVSNFLEICQKTLRFTQFSG